MTEESKKFCRKCKTVKPHSEFYKNKSVADGRQSACRECCVNRQRVRLSRLKNEQAALAIDPVDFERISKALRTFMPATPHQRSALLDAWADATPWYTPRLSDQGKELRVMGSLE